MNHHARTSQDQRAASGPSLRPPTRGARRAAGAAIAALVATSGAPAFGEESKAKACVDAYHASQELRLEHKLFKAREKATQCSQEACPTAVRSGCTKWLSELLASQPTLALSARGPDGNDVTDVSVEIDGERIAQSLTGRPIEVEPGKRKLRFMHKGRVVTQEVLVSEGVKNRQIVIAFEDPSRRSIDGGKTAEPSRAPIGAFVLGGVGVASLATFAALAATGTSDVNDLRDTCGATQSCPTSSVDDAKTKILVGDVFLVAGSLTLSASAIWLIAHYTGRPASPSSSAVNWSVGPTPGGAFGAISLRY
jgi:hypothetical protein